MNPQTNAILAPIALRRNELRCPGEHSMTQEPSNKAADYVFISYSTEQLAYAQQVNTYLNSLGFNTWFAPEKIKVSDNWMESLGQGIDDCHAVMFIWTPNSVASSWCQREICLAAECNKPILRLM